jgi:peptidoglycan/xylan/chitin deacetylase (PgdA/CDA1 family)
MNRIRIATAAVVLATGLFLVGCGTANQPDAGTWHNAPVSEDSGGSGGGEGVTASLEGAASASAPTGTNGVQERTGNNSVALTFDDGPDPKYTPKILEILRKNHVHATFCLIGQNAKAYPDLVRAIVADGHTLCNHTWKHDLKLGTRDEATIRSDLQRTNDAILAAVPDAKIPFFRHPGGMWTKRAVQIATSMGMKCAGWEVDANDWNTAKYHAGEVMAQHVESVLRTEIKPGSIVLMHDAGGDRSGTMQAVETVLPELLAKYQLVSLA